nr:histone deacetylase complex subunit SAP130 isoform X1 [Ciona intestinalis]|eukprot:XP_002129935.1 histone deacetylase complex subunit SAP130 isoform X1 [Ciona intestinalis]
MSVNNTSPTISVSSSVSIGEPYSSNSEMLTAGNAKVSIAPPVVYQAIHKLPQTTISTGGSTPLIQEPLFSGSKQSFSSTSNSVTASSTVLVTVAPKQMIQAGSIINLAPATGTSIPAAKPYGKHQLPVRAIPVAGISHVAPKTSAGDAASVTTAFIDPGGGYSTKTLPVQTTLISPAIKPSKAQPILMAPGLRSPAPSTVKLQQTVYAPNAYHSYPVPAQTHTSNASLSKPAVISVTTPKVQPGIQIPVRSIYHGRTANPSSSTHDPSTIRRSSNVLYQPTTTISISVPARPNSHFEPPTSVLQIPAASGRTTCSHGVKPLYQIGLAPPLTTAASTKHQKLIVAHQPTSTVSVTVSSNQNAPFNTSASSVNATSVTAFTYSPASSRLAPNSFITSSSVPVAKVYPQQPPQRVHTLQPSVSGISAHARPAEFSIPTTIRQASVAMTTTQSSVSRSAVVTTVASTRPQNQPVIPSMLYWQQPGININIPYAATPNPSYGFRPAVTSVPASQFRINQNLLVMETAASGASSQSVTTFSQSGQPMSSVSINTIPNDQPRGPPSASHQPHMSPKPAILRRPARSETSVSKKLTLNSTDVHRVGGPISPIKMEHSVKENGNVAPKKRFVSNELIYPTPIIKPVIPGQVNLLKPIVTSNGITTISRIPKINKPSTEFITTNYMKTTVPSDKDPNVIQIGRHTQQTIGEIKIKNEVNFPHSGTVPNHLLHSHFHSVVKKEQPSKLQEESRVQVFQDVAAVYTVASTSNYPTVHQQQATNRSAFPHPMGTHRQTEPVLRTLRNIKPEPNPTVTGVKRDYDKISAFPMDKSRDPGKQIMHPSIPASLADPDPSVGLSPRKKPRKQTHIVAKELPDTEQVVDDEMSTDDADEFEDEQPLISMMNNEANAAIKLEGSNKAKNRLFYFDKQEAIKKVEEEKIKPKQEYTDAEGIRYIQVRKRPPISLLNGHRTKPVNNHFTHYSDVKVKETKTSLHNPCFNVKRLKGWKIAQLALQLDELALLDVDILRRISTIKDGLLQHAVHPAGNGIKAAETGCLSPAHTGQGSCLACPITPSVNTNNLTYTPTNFGKTLSNNSEGASGPTTPTITPVERKANRIREDIFKIEEMAQANIQRSNVMQEQLSEAKTAVMKALDHHTLVSKVVEMGRQVQRPKTPSSSSSSRSAKKKKS